MYRNWILIEVNMRTGAMKFLGDFVTESGARTVAGRTRPANHCLHIVMAALTMDGKDWDENSAHDTLSMIRK